MCPQLSHIQMLSMDWLLLTKHSIHGFSQLALSLVIRAYLAHFGAGSTQTRLLKAFLGTLSVALLLLFVEVSADIPRVLRCACVCL